MTDIIGPVRERIRPTHSADVFLADIAAQRGHFFEISEMAQGFALGFGRSAPFFDQLADFVFQMEAQFFIHVRLDIRTAAGAAVLERLLAASDVLIENFRPGSLERLGLDDARLEAINPRLVRLSITGFDRKAPRKRRPLAKSARG